MTSSRHLWSWFLLKDQFSIHTLPSIDTEKPASSATCSRFLLLTGCLQVLKKVMFAMVLSKFKALHKLFNG